MGGNGGLGAATRRFLGGNGRGGGPNAARRAQVVQQGRRNAARRGVTLRAGQNLPAVERQRNVGARTRRAVARARARGGR